MFDGRTDNVRNRIYITHTDKMGEADAKEAANTVISELETLDPGFAVVNDMTEFKPQTQEVKAEIARAKQAIDESDVGTVVRISPDSSIARMQMDRAGEVDYDVEVVDSLDEANALLDETT